MSDIIPACFIDEIKRISIQQNLTLDEIMFESIKEYIERDKVKYVTFTEQEFAEEIWQGIPGFEGSYEASTIGRIRSLDREIINYKNTKIFKKGRIIKQSYNGGYLYVKLNVNSKEKSCAIHQVVAKTFIPNPLNYPIVHHKNDIKTNNKVINLEWTDSSGNIKAAYASGRVNKALGENHGNSTFKNEDILKIRELAKQGVTDKTIAKMMGVTRSTIYKIVNYINWKHLNIV